MQLSISSSRVFVYPCLIWTLVFIGSAPSLSATPEAEALNDEKWVDGPEAVQLGNSRSYPDVAISNEGMRIHVWMESGIGGSSAGEILLRRWGADGSPLEDPKQVNTTTDDIQRHPRVAVSADGRFLVIWQSWELDPGTGATRIVVRSRLYDSSGNPLTPEQKVSSVFTNLATDTRADVAALRVAGGGSGGYMVVWISANSAGTDTGWSVEGSLISDSGVPGAQFQVNSRDAAGNENYASVVELKDGGFLVTWEVDDQIWGRRFNAAAGPIGNDFRITTTGSNSRYDNDAAIGWDGKILVVWSDAEGDAGTNGKEIRGRLFDPELNPLGPDFRINTVTVDAQEIPKVADYGPEGFLVAWESEVSSGADSDDSIEARVVTGPNQFDGAQFQLNVWDNDRRQQLVGAHGWYGSFGAAWRSLTWDGNPSPSNQNESFIVGRDSTQCIFCDDLDWFDPGGAGNLWRWAAAVGASP